MQTPPPTSVSTRAPTPPALVVFDSGIGGMHALCEVLRSFSELRPMAPLSAIYLADTTCFPYSALTSAQMSARARELMEFMHAFTPAPPQLTVYACHSLSTHLDPDLLQQGSVHVPIVPAIDLLHAGHDPAGAAHTLILCTPTTAAALHANSGHSQPPAADFSLSSNVTVYGNPELATICEHIFFDGKAPARAVASFTTAFTQVLAKHPEIEHILLSCTHYIYAKPIIAQILTRQDPSHAGQPVTVTDSTELILAQHQALIRQVAKSAPRSPIPTKPPAYQPNNRPPAAVDITVLSDYSPARCHAITQFVQSRIASATCHFKSLKTLMSEHPSSLHSAP